MLYYATYMLPSGQWQSTAIFEDNRKAEETMAFHAQGRPYIVAESEDELEQKKLDIE